MRVYPYNSVMRDLAVVANAMNRTLERGSYDYARNGGSNGESGEQPVRALRLPIDAWATEEAYVVNAWLPGVDAEAVEITFEGEELTIRGEFPAPVEGVDYARSELFHGAFERKIGFNAPVDAEAIEATFENGVLTLRVPKAESVKPKQIKVVAK